MAPALSGLILFTSLAACGGGDDDPGNYAGIYEISTHTINEEACDVEGPAIVDGYSHFRLRKDEFFGEPFLALGECSSAEDESCDDAGLFSAYIYSGGAWRYQVSVASGVSTCYLSYIDGTLEDLGGGSVRIEIRQYSDEVPSLAGDACTTEEAERRGKDMPCDSYEAMVGTLVP